MNRQQIQRIQQRKFSVNPIQELQMLNRDRQVVNNFLVMASIFSFVIAMIIVYNIYMNFVRVKENSLFTITQTNVRLNETQYTEKIKELYFIVAIFLLILAISGNFVAEVFSCQLQRFLSHNMLAKHFIILVMVYFTFSFTGTPNVNPIVNLQKALMVYFFFLIFNRMSLSYTNLSILLLCIILVLKHYIDYYHSNDINPVQVENLINICDFLFLVLVFIISFGFIQYLFKQIKDYGSNFDFVTFIFGKPSCMNNTQ